VTIEKCEKLEKVDIRYLKDNKELNVKDCPKLTYLNVNLLRKLGCSGNELEKLELHCPKLTYLNVSYNKLTDLDFFKTKDEKHPKNLEELYIHGNSFEKINLTDFSKLKKLFISPSNEKKIDIKKPDKTKIIECLDAQKWLDEGGWKSEENKDKKEEDIETLNLDSKHLKRLKENPEGKGLNDLNTLDISNNPPLSLDKGFRTKGNNENVSLKTLQNLPKLKTLYIDESSITEEVLKKLPLSLEKIYCGEIKKDNTKKEIKKARQEKINKSFKDEEETKELISRIISENEDESESSQQSQSL
ncbi:10074_t:CDS:2, partial [Cetraspora pellucida]